MADNIEDIEELDEEAQQLYEHFRFVVDKGQEALRVDKYMCEKLQHSSRNRIQKAADAGFVHVNDRPVKSNYKVRPGDVVTLMLDRPRFDSTIEAEDIPLDIVYEDSELMVVNKPAGLVVHPGVGNFHGTLVNAVAWHMKDVGSFDPNDPEVGLVHRIDKDTSGLLVVAKTPAAKTSLGAQFFNKTTHRSYVALVWGNFNEDEGRIEGNITRDPKDRLRMTVCPPDSGIGKPAVTHYRRRMRDIAGQQKLLLQGVHHQLLQALRPSGTARPHPRLPPSAHRQADGLRLPATRRPCRADRKVARIHIRDKQQHI